MMRQSPWSIWRHRITPTTLRQDLLAGLTGALIVLPQGIAYASIAGLPPQFGLYCAVAPVIIAALFGSSWHMVSGPTAAISIVVFSTLAPLAAPTSADYISLAFTLCFLVGLIQFAIGAARLGRLAQYISHSVIVGFTSGAAFLIAASQMKHLLGLNITATSFFGQLSETVAQLPQTQWPIAATGATAFFVALISPRINRRLPHMILAMAAAAVVAAWLGGVPTVAPISVVLPTVSLPAMDPAVWATLSANALIIAVLGLTEALAISRSLALRSGQSIDSNQEVIGQGLSNLIGSFLSAYPSSGSFTRSGLNLEAGAQTPLAAVFSPLFLLAILFLISHWISYLPLAAMAGLLLLVARGLVDRRAIAAIVRGPRGELLVFAITFSCTLLVQLEYAVFIGIAVSWLVRRAGFGEEHGEH